MRAVLKEIFEQLLERHRASGRLDLNDIDEVVGARALTYEDVEMLIDALESAGLRVGEPLDHEDVQLMHEVIEAARGLRSSLGRSPTVQEIAGASGHPSHVVRRALERAQSAARPR